MTRPTRLLIITDCPHGGTFHVATLLAAGLRDAFAITFAAPRAGDGSQAGAHLASLSISVMTSPLSYENLDRSSYATDEAADIVEAAQPDLVLTVDGAELSSLLAVKAVARRRHIPYVIIINLLSEDVLDRFGRFMDDSRPSLAAAAAVVFVSAASRERCERLLPDLRFDAHVIPNSCPDSFFRPTDEATRRALRRSLGVGEEQVLCLTAARIEERKGQALGVAALGRLKWSGRLALFRWILAGRAEAWDRNKLEEAIAKADVGAHVSLLGERDDIAALMDASDLFVLTSYAEGMPLCILEALAKGVPVLATAIDGIVEQIDEDCGVLLPPATDPDACIAALADTLDRLEQDRKLLERLGDGARRRARSLFHRDVCLSRYRTLLSSLVEMQLNRPLSEPGLCSGPPTSPSLNFGEPAQIWNHLQDGWAKCDKDGVWTDGTSSTMRLRLNGDAAAVRLRFDVTPFDKRRHSRATSIFANEQKIGTWRTRRGRQTLNLDIEMPPTGRDLLLRFENPGATRPCDIGLSDDYRQLALFFHRLHIIEIGKPSFRSRFARRVAARFGR